MKEPHVIAGKGGRSERGEERNAGEGGEGGERGVDARDRKKKGTWEDKMEQDGNEIGGERTEENACQGLGPYISMPCTCAGNLLREG